MVEWSTVTVESCLERLTLGKIPKVLTRDYKPSGSYPIIDQGQSPIAGWTDDDSGLISTNLPVVIFGDHTRAFKYVDFPFVRGADGTQLLKPQSLDRFVVLLTTPAEQLICRVVDTIDTSRH